MTTTRAGARAYAKKWHLGGPSCGSIGEHHAQPKVAPEVFSERDRLFALPRGLTESICGDPLPGRSALDQKRRPQEQQSWTSRKPPST